ncbi:PDR/VanB family oxidoreductase [Kibdelosporangium phytohabitans]|uniref:Phthalate 4,5-dioxygenase n=1 Tax=Kibdelosporangium phytohabitans TaxID=860235 RepID=A0A0N9I5B1_9PSEU|nr:PDR/VanB family oxidoreductase [Kibdelosporangium phytohabitans]ALG09579.1 phthalate 4,5-dioxygenase [Kibdelosporangium phytohabitans]MBE1469093.1 ferredoxin-NADP reductase [Kibdelosporangium phytohabitans]
MQTTVLERVEQVADGAVSLVLRGAGGPLAAWEPGAHVDLALPNWLTRQYSLCGNPADHDSYRVAVRHDRLSRGGSEYIHLFLRTGRTLDVSLPRNNFPLLPAPEYLFIAGGIGITPIVPMLAAAVEAGAPATLVYVGRTLATMPFADELRANHGDRVRIYATEDRGRPDLAALAATLSPQGLVYCCGPTSMLDAVEAAFPAQRLHVERFQPTVKQFAPDQPFEVHCVRSGQIVRVGAEESVLDALNHAGSRVRSGCREGVCGSCEITVVDGEPEHRDDIGAPPGRMYCCVSRSLSGRLVVDL